MFEQSQPTDLVIITIVGKVFDIKDGDAIEGARVIALDENNVAVSETAFTDTRGEFELQMSVPRDAKAVKASYMLHVHAAWYQPFPTPPRTALSFNISDAIKSGEAADALRLESTATHIGLLPLTNGVGSISGKVFSNAPEGTLVVAGTTTGIADLKGNYTIFNVPAGEFTVRAYAKGVNFITRNAIVKAGKETKGIDLEVLSIATAIVSGNVQLVNAPANLVTSVALFVEDTFNETRMRGEVPPGLRVDGLTGMWSIDKVPNGKYVILAAFENDGLIRDPDPTLGDPIMHLSVSGGDVIIPNNIKLTGALDVIVPGGEGTQVINDTPRFEWSTGSSVDLYRVSLVDAFGNQIWEMEVPGESGVSSMYVAYIGPTLSRGMFYQFRAVAIRNGVPSSSTEDLKGVFLYQ